MKRGFHCFRARTAVAQNLCFPMVFLVFCMKGGFHFFPARTAVAQNLCFPMVFLAFCMERGFHFFVHALLWPETYVFLWVPCVLHEKGVPFLSCAHCYGSKPMFSYGFPCVLHEKGIHFPRSRTVVALKAWLPCLAGRRSHPLYIHFSANASWQHGDN